MNLATILAAAGTTDMAAGQRATDLLVTLTSTPQARRPGFVAGVWRGTRHPSTALSAASWVGLFRRAGYAFDGRPARRPAEAVTLWRGCTPEGRFGMAWSTDPAVARRFAHGAEDRLYRAIVQPVHLLAYISDPRNPEREFVVDPAGLTDANVVEA